MKKVGELIGAYVYFLYFTLNLIVHIMKKVVPVLIALSIVLICIEYNEMLFIVMIMSLLFLAYIQYGKDKNHEFQRVEEKLNKAKWIGVFKVKYLEKYEECATWNEDELLKIRAVCQSRLKSGKLSTLIISIVALILSITSMFMQIYSLLFSKIPVEEVPDDFPNELLNIVAYAILIVLIPSVVAIVGYVINEFGRYKALITICNAHLEKIHNR